MTGENAETKETHRKRRTDARTVRERNARCNRMAELIWRTKKTDRVAGGSIFYDAVDTFKKGVEIVKTARYATMEVGETALNKAKNKVDDLLEAENSPVRKDQDGSYRFREKLSVKLILHCRFFRIPIRNTPPNQRGICIQKWWYAIPVI